MAPLLPGTGYSPDPLIKCPRFPICPGHAESADQITNGVKDGNARKWHVELGYDRWDLPNASQAFFLVGTTYTTLSEQCVDLCLFQHPKVHPTQTHSERGKRVTAISRPSWEIHCKWCWFTPIVQISLCPGILPTQCTLCWTGTFVGQRCIIIVQQMGPKR